MKHSITSRIKRKISKLRNKSANKYKVSSVPLTIPVPGNINRKRSSRVRKNKSTSKIIPGTASE